jgi:hypothetical protein
MHRTGILIATAIVVSLGGLALISTGTARAGGPDYTVCDGLSARAAWGMCRAGVAAGCADGTGNPTACGEIEDMYATVTGGVPAPWLWEPCPFDFEGVAKDSSVWPLSVDGIAPSVRVSCDSSLTRVLALVPVVPSIYDCPQLRIEQPGGPSLGGAVRTWTDCTDAPPPAPLISVFEAPTCHQDLIAYGNALAAIEDDDIIVDNVCLP